MKHIRLGFTESTLLLIYYIENILNIEQDNVKLQSIKNNMINWLYCTSGFYDSSVKGKAFGQFDCRDADTKIYNKYMSILLNYLKDCDIFTPLFIDIPISNIQQYIDSLMKYLNVKSINHRTQFIMYEMIPDKRVLIISSFAELIKIQIDSGNYKNIYDNFPSINKVITYTTPYTFFNSGNESNILATVNKITEKLEKYKDDFDVAIIAAGAYSGLIVGYINDIMGKDATCIGGDIQEFFGIANTRLKNYYKNTGKSFYRSESWIMNIPDKYKPKDYMKIEGGCYW